GGAALVALGTAEIGKHLVPRPAIAAEIGPAVIVGAMAPHVEHGVDGAGAAERPAPRLVSTAPAEARLRLCDEGPVVDLRPSGQHRDGAHRRADEEVTALAAGL